MVAGSVCAAEAPDYGRMAGLTFATASAEDRAGTRQFLGGAGGARVASVLACIYGGVSIFHRMEPGSGDSGPAGRPRSSGGGVLRAGIQREDLKRIRGRLTDYRRIGWMFH